MERYDYRSNDLLGAARYAAIYADGLVDTPDEPSPSELAEDEFEREPAVVADPELLAVFDEVYGAETVATDLPF